MAGTSPLTRVGLAGIAVAAVAVGSVVPVTGALAQGEVEYRVREYEHRVRGYSIRVETLDGSERQEETPTQRTVIFDADVLFEFDSDELDGDAESRLDTLAGELGDLGPREVTIDGHTDSTGSSSYNQDLSERRAGTVRDTLEAELSSGFTFEVTGHGDADPVADNDTEEGQARNRRVEISFPTVEEE